MKEKDRRGGSGGDRFAVFPFSIGCMSQSSVAVADPNEKKQQSQSDTSSTTATTATAPSSEEGGGEATITKEKATTTPASSPGGIVTAGVQRLVKGIKSMFAVYDGDDDEEEEEMVIGYPTDVQHVGHIGWDGLNKVGGAMGMVNAFSLPPSLSLSQLEVAMDQAAAAHA